MDKPVTTLFLITSLDGKITIGDNESLDVDLDFKRISGVKEGLHQYYEIEKTTDNYSLNTGRVMEKIGINTRTIDPKKMGCSFVIIDNKPHLNEKGVVYLAKWVKKLILVTTNDNHPALSVKENYKNIEIIRYRQKIDLKDLLSKLKKDYKVNRLTIQSGGTLNSFWIREGLIDYVSVVVAPCLIGGVNTLSLIGGESLHTEEDLKLIKSLQLLKNTTLENSYIHLYYEVRKNTIIDPK